jgi:hypothetical protein
MPTLKLPGIHMKIFDKFFRKIGPEEENWCFSNAISPTISKFGTKRSLEIFLKERRRFWQD